MNCYLCSKEPLPGGMYFIRSQAVAVCSRCCAAVCDKHLIFALQEEGKMAVCRTCAALAELHNPSSTDTGTKIK